VTDTPYASCATDYWDAGWRGVLPLPTNEKTPPPDGFTGAHGIWPSYADVMAWVEDRPHANIALRLPPDVIGIDADCYDDKRGAITMAKAYEQYGELPPTWSSTARVVGSGSGIFLFRVPVGLRWPGQVGPDVEIIQTRHRYMVAPPSFHPTGRTYQWYSGLGVALIPDAPVPSPADLPNLPDAWVAGLTGGAAEVDFVKGEASSAQVSAWVCAPAAVDKPCRIMLARLDRLLSDLTTGGSRHDTALRGVMAFAHLATEGHRGVTYALFEFYKMWRDAVTSGGTGKRTPAEAAAEWDRMLSGAVGWALINGPGDQPDPCDNPFDGILAPDANASDATLYRVPEQGGVAQSPSVAAPSAPPSQGSVGSVPPAWVTEQNHSAPEGVRTLGGAAPGAVSGPSEDASTWDRRAIAVALELERLEVRRDARLELTRAEHMRTWREPPSYSLREMLALPDEPLHWRVHDVMPEGANVLLAAQFKTGKTTLINELTKSLVDGVEFLGAYKIPDTTRVALFNYEVGQAQYARWLRDRAIANADAVHVFNLRGFTLPLSVPLVRDHVTRWLKAHEITVWVVDPFARAFTGGNENDNAEVGQWLEILDQIKEESGVTELVMPTHTGRADFAPGTERARGATRLDDWCDVRWLLTKDDEGNRYFRATGRDVDTEETKLEFDPVTRALSLGEGSRPRRGAAGGDRSGYARQNGAQGVEDMVLEVVADEPGASQRKIRAEARLRGLSVNNITIAEAARRLAQQGRLRVETRDLGGGRSITAHYVVGAVPYAGDAE
jgi:hypothetical protein